MPTDKEVYLGYTSRLRRVKARTKGLAQAKWSQTDLDEYTEAISGMVAAFPRLEGFWIQYAAFNFQRNDFAETRRVFEAGTRAVPASPDLWVKYLEFLVMSNASDKLIGAAFDNARKNIGTHFYSHEFWDFYLAYLLRQTASDPEAPTAFIRTLVYILKDLTIHQYSKYYEYLVAITRRRHVAPETLGLDLGQKTQTETKWAVVSKTLSELYTQQQERVRKAWEYEKLLTRRFFHPKALPSDQTQAWIAYLGATTDPAQKLSLYSRALLVGGSNSDLWLEFIRWQISTGTDPADTMLLAVESAPITESAVKIYAANWFELRGDHQAALKIYEKAYQGFNTSPQSPNLPVQFSKFLHRQAAKLPDLADLDSQKVLLNALDVDDISAETVAAILTELAVYDDQAFDSYELKKQPEDKPFWHAFVTTFPDRAGEIYRLAPPGLVNQEILQATLLRSAKDYIELDRQMHRSAFDPLGP